MNLITFLFLVGAFRTAFVESGKVKEMCLAQEGVTAEEVKARHHQEIPDPKVKCFFRCFLENIGLLADNEIVPGGFAKVFGKILSDEAIERMEQDCNAIKADPNEQDPCEFPWLVSACYEGLKISDLRPQLKELHHHSRSGHHHSSSGHHHSRSHRHQPISHRHQPIAPQIQPRVRRQKG
ncbi:general odorant-binding protein 56a [Drosophila rhopaloa]|uniref:General odorant-binding protein 56a n=1 Tax=Drosophila rhopaloa TaxID=1041015 RepID=A0A6P4EEZ5_DRORH|nr:general odorant-binding protein 56a [Drosophila rhopaloa]